MYRLLSRDIIFVEVIMYRIGLPFWKLLARRGVPMHLRVIVQRDNEASVYIATSPDLNGFIVESETIDDLIKESSDVANMLLDEYLSNSNHAEPEFRLRSITNA